MIWMTFLLGDFSSVREDCLVEVISLWELCILKD